MPAVRSRRRARLAALTSVALAVTGFQFFLAPQAAQADVATKISSFPYTQDWSNAGLITANDDWSGVSGVQGYSEDTAAGTGVDPQTLVAAALSTTTDVVANQPATASNGGVLEVQGETIAIQGSGSADSPNVVFHLDLTGATGTTFAFAARDLDASADNAIQQIAVQYRVGSTGDYTNLPAGYVADATEQGTATKSTAVSVILPAAVDNNNDVYVRVMTTNAIGNDELVGIDNINIAQGVAPTPVTVTSPGAKTGTVGVPITNFTLAATGGTPPYTWTAESGLPPGITVDADGTVHGTPTTAGDYDPVVRATDNAATPVSDTETFSFDIAPAPAGVTAIKDIQGTGTASTMVGNVVNTEGVVTARYASGGLNGFYIQTGGADTATASDAILVQGAGTFPNIGDSVDVTGTVSESFDLTRLTGATWSAHTPALPAVEYKQVIPGTDCAEGACPDAAALDTAREAVEGEAFRPGAGHPWTLTDVYDGAPYYSNGTNNNSANFGELGVAAESARPLVAPTELYDAQTELALVNAKKAYNDAHRIILDDGTSTNYNENATTKALPVPWLTATHQPRVGAAVTFPNNAAVIVVKDFGAWRALSSTPVSGAPTADQPQLQQTRSAIAAGPEDVGGDVKLATFNVLNFFPTTGNEFVTSGLGTCTYFTDRDGNQTTNNQCNPNGPRGAANATMLARQRDKIVAAINGANADVVSLEELENSVKFGKPRDFAINELVTALNAAAGAGTWAAVPSPSAANLPALADQDVIRNGFIYKPANVALVGASVVLADESTGTQAFADAREPLAQAFKEVGSPDADAFAVIVNHFKSKGSGTPDPIQGAANDRRVLQAQSLVDFANEFKAARGITRVFLAGDFNAYSEEDPIQVLNAAGYTNLESTFDPQEESYNFDGQVGSLDHVLANAAAMADIEDVDIWPINSYESVYYEYSRFNQNVTNLYVANPFRSSDHNPEIIGINAPAEPATRDIQILGTNDFHGRIANDPTTASAGAAVMAGAVKQLRGQNPNTVFAAAGDLIGATTFESFIDRDKPTIDALNSAGLEVSSVGNHEFDQGVDDLMNRVIAPYDPATNPKGGAAWKYLAANIRKKSDGQRLLAPSWTKEFGAVKVGFIGAVTEHLPELVSPAGIASIDVTNVVTEVNQEATALEAGGADVIVLLVHEGASRTDCTGDILDPASDFGEIVTGVNDKIDAIVSGHTHLEYNCSFPVPAWAGDATHPVKERPVVSSGQYGFALNRLIFKVDTATGVVLTKTQDVLKLKSGTSGSNFNYPVDQPTQDIVTAAVNAAAVEGAKPAGKISGPLYRGKLADGTTENRGQESTLGNLVAEVQQDATEDPALGGAQIAFMNPGGLRQDLLGAGSTSPRDVTFRQIADVQPFGNTLVNLKLTGAQIKTVLEQQWQPTGAQRPYLRLGVSKGFTYTYDPAAGTGQRIKGMWLDGTAIDPATKYSVTANAFLAAGGDNFTEFANGTEKKDAGQVDLQAFLNYMTKNFATTPLPVDYSQRAVGVSFPAGSPASYDAGGRVRFNVSSWSMTGPGDVKDSEVVVKLGSTTLGTAPLDHTPVATTDEAGKATVDVVLPDTLALGTHTLTLSGAATGTTVPVTVTVGRAKPAVDAGGPVVRYGRAGTVTVKVSGPGGVAPSGGTVTVKVNGVVLGSGPVSGSGVATISLPAKGLTPGTTTLTAEYSGSSNLTPGSGSFNVTVTKAEASVEAKVKPGSPSKKQNVKLRVTVDGSDGVEATGEVKVVVDGETFYGVLENGKLKLVLGKFGKGKHKAKVVYSGSALVANGKAKVTFTVS